MPQEAKHLYDTGWVPDEERDNRFFANREIDTESLPTLELDRALKSAGYKDRQKRQEIMQSARDPSRDTRGGHPDWARRKVRAGSKFYGLTTVADDDRGFKSHASAFWLSESQIERFERDGLIDLETKKIEAAEIKNRLALPCTNRVNGLVEAQVTRDHDAIRTTVGRAMDVYTVGNEERSRWMEGGEEQWHPRLDALDLDRTINRQKLAERDGLVADYRLFDIRYSPADQQNRMAAEYARGEAEREGYPSAVTDDPAPSGAPQWPRNDPGSLKQGNQQDGP